MNWGERRREVQCALKPEPGWRRTKKLHGTYAGRYRIQLANILRSHVRNILKYNSLWWKWMLLVVFFRDSISVHAKTHAERLLFEIPDAEETRRREAAYSDEPTSKMDYKLPGKDRKFHGLKGFECNPPLYFFLLSYLGGEEASNLDPNLESLPQSSVSCCPRCWKIERKKATPLSVLIGPCATALL